ncbi:MAG: MFS transporter [Phenylobacterium sp.]|uniref:MFS transporter n=1 Tax=Phenylobacterium sp. TaxID=1871053 RepID=UPI001A46A9B2|nr:MFS transporter [Phenylobacterium sp.]MBL8774186.1 MFS transporter [Phenylobacterium sp.]
MTEAVGRAQAASGAQPGPPTIWTKLAYGFGSVAYGVKDNGFNYFLLLFYSQVIGVDARLVGLAITTALVLDALSDPIVGYWSDNFHSRFGRRHPFMYASAIPVAATYFLMWNPPQGWSDQALFVYLLVMAVLIRTFITFYETPSSALAPELTDDYDQRSSLLSFRFYFGWTGGNVMSVLMFMALFPMFVTATIPDGRFNREAYELYGIIASALIFLAIIVSAGGTHARIRHLKPPPPKRSMTLSTVFREIIETLVNRSFVSLFFAALLGAVATGLSAALAFYFSIYFWRFDPQQIGWVTISVFGSAIIGSVMAPYITRTLGKKRGAIIIGLVAFLGNPLPVTLKLIGVLPDDPGFNFPIVVATTMIDTGLIICFQILSSSMLADLVEQAELRTGRRSEGLFFAASTFIRKAVQGVGVIAAGFVLTFAGFPAGASPDQVSDETLWRFGALYVPTILAIWLAMIAVMTTYKLSRDDHEENLRKLAQARSGGGG